MALTGKRLKFAQEYAVDQNATQAAIRAGYSAKTAYAQGSRLLKNVEVRQVAGLAQLTAAEEAGIRASEVLLELGRLAYSDPSRVVDENELLLPLKKMPLEVRRAIASIEIEELFDGRGENRVQTGVLRKVKFWDKPKSLELLAKHLKLLTDKVEHEVGASLEDLIRKSMEPPKENK